MGESADQAADLLSVVTLFTICIDCFEFYKGTEDYKSELKTLLIQLDFEKARLLKWAEHVGLVEASLKQQGIDLERLLEPSLWNALERIKVLLTGTNQAQAMFGLQQRSEPDIPPPPYALELGPIAEVVSRNSMTIFRTNYGRFCAKYEMLLPRPKLVSKKDWLIRESAKFVGLINALKEVVDDLFSLLDLEKSVHEEAIELDILSNTNLYELRLVADAANASSYRIAEYLTLTSPGVQSYLAHERLDEQHSHRISLLNLSPAKAFFMVTPQCRSYDDSCTDGDFDRWPRRDGYEHGANSGAESSNSVASRLVQQIHLQASLFQLNDLEDYLGTAKKMDENGEPHPIEPPAAVIVYVAPCLRLVSTANSLHASAGGGKARLLRFHICEDDRLYCSCSSGDGTQARLSALATRWRDLSVTGWEDLYELLDLTKMEQRVYELDTDRSTIPASGSLDYIFDSRANRVDLQEPVAAIVVIGEDREIIRIFEGLPMVQMSRMPAPGKFYAVAGNQQPARRQFLGTYKLHKNLVPRTFNTSARDVNDRLSPSSEAQPAILETPNSNKRKMPLQGSRAASQHEES